MNSCMVQEGLWRYDDTASLARARARARPGAYWSG